MIRKSVFFFLTLSLALTALCGCGRTARRFSADSTLDIETLNEVFRLKFGSDVTIVDFSFTESSYGDDEDDYETILDAVVEFPVEKYDEYFKMIDGAYILSDAGEESETYSGALKTQFASRKAEPDSVFIRFDSYKTEERSLFGGSETTHPFTPIVGIEKGETAATVYLHTVVY